MTVRAEWEDRVGRSWAEMYRQTDRSFAQLTQHLLERIAAAEGRQVLDVGCGAGELSLAIARSRQHARVTGIDVSAELVALATERGTHLTNAVFAVADAALWCPDDGGAPPDLVVSRHGVMFFDDPVGAFAHMRAVSAPGAALVFSCFRERALNPWAADLAALLPAGGAPPQPAPGEPGPFAFADKDGVRAILRDAGWQDAAFEPLDYAYVAGHGDDPVADALAFFRRIGPAARVLAALPPERQVAVISGMTEWLARHRDGDLVAFPAAAWIVSARNG